MKFKALVFMLVLCCTWPLLAQQECDSVTFAAKLTPNQKFKYNIGNDIWFIAYPDKAYWTIKIGPGREPNEPLDIGWSLDGGWNPEWQLGPTRGLDAKAAMEYSPRRLWFATNEKDFKRLKDAQFRALSSDSYVAFGGENDPGKVIAEIPKGMAEVTISGFHVTDPKDGKREVDSASLMVRIILPHTFQLQGAKPSSCPTEKPPSF